MNLRLPQVCALSPIVCFMISCGSSEGTFGTLSSSSLTYNLGDGIDPSRPGFLERCVDGKVEDITEARTTWEFRSDFNQNDILNNLGFNSDVEFAFGLAKAESNASFARETLNSSLSINYFLHAEYILGEKKLNQVSINQLGTEAMVQANTCGSHYVSSLLYGGRIMALIKFNFASQKAKNQAALHMKGQFVRGKADIAINGLSQQDQENGHVTITIKSMGGAVDNLGLGKSSVSRCKLSDWNACAQFIEELDIYSRNGFPLSLAGATANLGFATKPLPYQAHPEVDQDFKQQKYLAVRKAMTILQTLEDMYLLKADTSIADSLRTAIRADIKKLEDSQRRLLDWIAQCTPKGDNREGRCQDIQDLDLHEVQLDQISTGPTEVNSAYVGGKGGRWFQGKCRNFIKGVHGSFGRILNQIGLQCDDGSQTNRVGKRQTRTWYHETCPGQSLVTGFKARSRKFRLKEVVAELTLICSDPRADQHQEVDVNIMKMQPQDGGHMVFRCPPGWAASQIQGHAGYWVDNLRLVCRQVGY